MAASVGPDRETFEVEREMTMSLQVVFRGDGRGWDDAAVMVAAV